MLAPPFPVCASYNSTRSPLWADRTCHPWTGSTIEDSTFHNHWGQTDISVLNVVSNPSSYRIETASVVVLFVDMLILVSLISCILSLISEMISASLRLFHSITVTRSRRQLLAGLAGVHVGFLIGSGKRLLALFRGDGISPSFTGMRELLSCVVLILTCRIKSGKEYFTRSGMEYMAPLNDLDEPP